MNPQIHADQGFKNREGIFVDSPLLHFIEDELLPAAGISPQTCFQAMAVLVDELGCEYRRLIKHLQFGDVSAQQHINNYRERLTSVKDSGLPMADIRFIRGNAAGAVDEFCCPVPACIVDAILTTVLAQACDTHFQVATQDQAHADLLNHLFARTQELLGVPATLISTRVDIAKDESQLAFLHPLSTPLAATA